MFFVPGHPGYQQYINTLYGITLIFCVGAGALSLSELRRNPRDLGRRAITAALLFLTAASVLGCPALSHAVAARLGSPNIVELFAAATGGVGSSTASIIALSAWQDPPEKQKKTIRLWLVIAACMLVTMLALWHASLLSKTLLHVFVDIGNDDNRFRLSTSLPDIVLVWATVKVRRLCGHHSRAPGRDWLSRGLRLVRQGANAQLLFFAGFAVVAAAHIAFDLTIPHPETFATPCIALAMVLVIAGISLPSAGPLLEMARERRAATRAYRELEPLWTDLADNNPHNALPHTTDTNINYLLYRRVVEIRDGLTRLAPHITPPHTDDNPQPGAQAAAQIHRALTAKHTHDETDQPDGFSPLAGDNPATNLETEIHWLRQTAKHYTQTKHTPEPAARG